MRRFEYYNFNLDPDRSIMVDGSGPLNLELSHWPGTSTDKRYWADTSTAICLNFLEMADVEKELEGVEVVTNNHFDEDGCLGLLCLINPELALAHKQLLLDCALFGDFKWYTTDDAAKLSLTISWLFDHPRSEFSQRKKDMSEWAWRDFCYREFFAECERGLLDDLDRYQHLWKGELEYIKRSLEIANQSEVLEFPDQDLGVLLTPKALHKSSASTRLKDFERQLIITRDSERRAPFAELRYNVRSFFATTQWFGTHRPDLSPLMSEWNTLERSHLADPDHWNAARWRAESPTIPTPRMR